MPRVAQPVRRRSARGRVPVVAVLVIWLVFFVSILGLTAVLVLQGMTIPAVVSAVTVLVAAAATASSTLTRTALTAAGLRRP